ncbi:MAG: Crp/Fnr family transcriptional regulator [Flavobacteriales bacterium]|jgi:CRP-like cAMP-binding protein|nr:Crp/Fnr family transcriptional regulator [Flavobacteriales bacterium]
MKNIFRDFIEKYHPISPEDWAIIEPFLIEKSFTTNEIITQQGDTEKCLYFLQEGVVRLFVELPDRDSTFDFAFSNEITSSYTSFLLQNPSECSIECLVDCKTLTIKYDDLQEIYQQTKIGNLIGRIVSEELFIHKSKRENDFLTLSAEERYNQIFKEHPKLILEIPQKYLASYIGITPQALSRIRRRQVD